MSSTLLPILEARCLLASSEVSSPSFWRFGRELSKKVHSHSPFRRDALALCEGDVFVTNDVYQIDGAVSHLNDVIVLLPIFYNHDLIGWVGISNILTHCSADLL